MRSLRVGNQIHEHGMGIHAMKIESTAVEMFYKGENGAYLVKTERIMP